MKTAEERELSEAQSQAVAGLVLEELARRRMSRKRLAADARISLSTLEKALNGNRGFTLATLVRLEQ
ncbi:MAG TPA: helix-turn-helix domain-containing protein, partial [Rhizomicrobium sp.]